MSQTTYNNQALVGAIDDPIRLVVTNVALLPAPVFLGLSELTPDGIENFAIGGTTSYSNPNLVFTSIVDAIYTLYDNGTLVGTMTAVRGVTTWTLSGLDNGVHNLSLTYSTADGTTSAPLTANFTVAAPVEVPQITTIVDAYGPNAGYIPPTGIATDTHPTVKGTGHAGDTINVYDNTTLLGTTVVGADGKWQFQPGAALPDGAHNIHATSTNTAGTSEGSSPYAFSTTQIMVTGATSNGVDVAQGGTATGTVTITGWLADPSLASNGMGLYIVGGNHGTLTLWDNLAQGSMTVSGNTFTATVAQTSAFATDFPLSAGTYHIEVRANGTSGQVSTISNPNLGWTFTDSFSTAAPAAPEITTIVDATGPHAGYIPQAGIATDTHPTVQGTGHAGDTINVYDKTTLLGTTVVGADGKWQFQPVAALPDGAHSIHATSTNAAGTSDGSSPYAFSTTQIMVTGVTSNGVDVANGGTASGTVTVTGWIADPSLASTGIAVYLTGGNQGTGRVWDNSSMGKMTIEGNTFTAVIAKDSLLPGNFPLVDGTYHIDVQAFGASGRVGTVSNADLGWTFTDNFSASTVQSVAATHSDASTAAAQAASADVQATASSAASDHAVLQSSSNNHTVDIGGDPASYFKDASAHIQGGASGVSTLHLSGDHHVLDLTSLTGKTAAAKVSGIESIDLGGAHNTVKLSLTDVLNLAEPDLFQKDGKHQMLVSGSNGDSVDLSNSHVAGVTDGHWAQEGAAQVGGVTYNVYEHSGAHVELLVQQGVQIALHA